MMSHHTMTWRRAAIACAIVAASAGATAAQEGVATPPTPGWTFTLGSRFGQILAAREIEVMPTTPDTIAMTTRTAKRKLRFAFIRTPA